MENCKHPATRLHSWSAYNYVTGKKDWLSIACCECGKVLKGGTEEFEEYCARHAKHN